MADEPTAFYKKQLRAALTKFRNKSSIHDSITRKPDGTFSIPKGLEMSVKGDTDGLISDWHRDKPLRDVYNALVKHLELETADDVFNYRDGGIVKRRAKCMRDGGIV